MEHTSTFTNHFLGEICKIVKTPGLNFREELKCDVLKKANKDQLSSWLEVLIVALDSHTVPYLKSTCQDAERVEQLKEEKISDQATIINLQTQLIDEKELQIKTVQETVQSEVKAVQNDMKTYSSVLQKEIRTQTSEVQKNVSSSVTAKKLGDVVKLVAEKEERGRNVVMFGFAEEQTEQLESRVEEILQRIGQKPRIVECCRLGRVKDGAVRPVKVTFSSLRNAKQLRNAEGCRKIFICPDRTVEQRRTQKELVVKLKKLRTENPGTNYSIKGGQVVQCESLAP